MTKARTVTFVPTLGNIDKPKRTLCEVPSDDVIHCILTRGKDLNVVDRVSRAAARSLRVRS